MRASFATRPEARGYIGAGIETVNTGELTGIHKALESIARWPQRKGHTYALYSDSMYALGRALSSGRSRKNKAAVRAVRVMLRKVRKRHGYRGITLSHVRGHSGNRGNDMADGLATRALHQRLTWERGEQWLRVFEDSIT